MPPQTNNTPTPLDACDPTLNATVSASAGSGKTWLLITRIVRLLIDGAEPGNIIALTFTRKAAGEMQIRLNERLFEMATAEDEKLDSLLQLIGCNSNEQNKTIARSLYEKLMNGLYPIRIQTFHSFCQDILSRFPLEADIPPGFDLIEDSSLLERQAWQALFDQAALPVKKNSVNRLANPLSRELDIIMRACNGPDNTRTALNSFLHHRSDWWAYTAHTQQAVDFACQQLAQQLQIDESDASNPVEEFLNDITRDKLKVFANLLREVKLIKGLQHADMIDAALDQKSDNNEGVFSLLRSAFLTQKGEPLSSGRTYSKALEKKLGADDAERFVDLHETIAAAILAVDETLKRRLTLQINSAWYFAGQQYVEIFQRLKREMRLLDFTDLEWKCYQLLQHGDNAHWVQYKIDQRIDHLLVDEFQDTNPTQWHLLSPILEEIAANPEERQRSVFLVGDEKQSIYSFRRANPALQVQASAWLAENLDAKATPLDFSRRSSSAIIHCVNLIFEQEAVKTIMTGYTTHDTHLQSLPGKVLLCDLFEQDENDDENSEHEATTEDEQQPFRNPLEQPREISVKTLRHDEADYIARQILQLVNTPELITDNGTVRAAEFGDVMILMRNRTHIAIYEDALKQHRIPFIGSKKGGLLDNLEIQDLNCLLNTLITPFNNLALAQVLKSPIFDASDGDLILLAQYNSSASAHWYERLLLLAEESTTDPDITTLSKPLQRASALLPRWQKMAEQLPVHDCLDRIFSEGNIINRYVAANSPDNKHKVAANCQRFLELSLETDSGRYPSITRFLQRLSHLESYSASPPEEPLSQNDESRVRLMTIHGSKGLESPVVFLADCNSMASNKNAYASLVRWPANKSQPVNFQLQLSKDNTDNITQELQHEKLSEQAREELNLLYVALTRAREQLYISGIESHRRQNNSWYQIISGGLSDIDDSETGIDDINGKIYEHLSYDRNSFDDAKSNNLSADIFTNTAPALTASDIDERLLKPVTDQPKPPFMIAPSLNIGETIFHQEPDPTATASTTTDMDYDAAELAKWRGVTIHRAIEQLCKSGEYPSTGKMVNSLQQRLMAEVTFHNLAHIDYLTDHLDNCIQEAVSTFDHPDFKSIFNPATDTKTYDEMPLMYMDNQQAVYGIIDRVIKTQDRVIIIDYKSHRLDSSESVTDVAQQFTAQLDYYRTGINKMWPQHTVESGILFTHHHEIIWVGSSG